MVFGFIEMGPTPKFPSEKGLGIVSYTKFKRKSLNCLLGRARGGFIAYFFTLITESENHVRIFNE